MTLDNRVGLSHLVQDYFGVEAGSGQVYIKTKLDRETTDRVVLEIMAEDMNADLGQQTATGENLKHVLVTRRSRLRLSKYDH